MANESEGRTDAPIRSSEAQTPQIDAAIVQDIWSPENRSIATGVTAESAAPTDSFSPRSSLPSLTLFDSNGPQQASQAQGNPSHAPIKDGVVQIRTKLGGTDIELKGSGFLVSPSGGESEPTDGNRLVATAYHAVRDWHSDSRRNYKVLGEGFGQSDSDRNGALSKAELEARLVHYAAAGSATATPDEQGVKQINHILQNFGGIQSVSREFASGVNGITQRGLSEYYARNTHSSVIAPDGTVFPAQLKATNRNADMAVLQIGGLNPAQEAAVGQNIPLSQNPATAGEQVSSLGYIKGQQRFVDGKVIGTTGGVDTPNNDFVETDTDIPGGLSGGPLVNRSGEALGITHAGVVGGVHGPVSTLRRLIQDATIERSPSTKKRR
jgi:S1-C subfamily serine protease